MSSYEYWKFNNIPIEYVMKSNYDAAKGTIQLTCYTEGDFYNDPRAIVEGWRAYESIDETRTATLAGHIALQSSKAGTFLLSNTIQNWNAILSKLSWVEDAFSKKVIFFTMDFTVGDTTFLDKYGKKYPYGFSYSNLLYKEYIDTGNYTNLLGQKLGEVQLTEAYPITRIDIYGGAINFPSWVEVNGVRKYWHYKYTEQIEKLIFLVPNETTATITSPNMYVQNGKYLGSKINAICSFYNENLNIIEVATEGM